MLLPALRLGLLAALAAASRLARYGTGWAGAGGSAAVILAAFVIWRFAPHRRRPLALFVLAIDLWIGTALYAFAPVPKSPLHSLGVIALGLAGVVIFALGTATPGRSEALRRTTLGLSSSVLWAVLAFGALESVTRQKERALPYTVEPTEDSAARPLVTYDAELLHVYAPHFRGRFVHPEYRGESFTTNSLGLRGAEWPAVWPAHERRVLLLGDSTAVGFGVADEETLSTALERRLATHTPTRVLNAAVAGYGARQALGLLRRIVERATPSDVVFVLYDGNDLEEDRVHARHTSAPSPDSMQPAGRTEPGSWAARLERGDAARRRPSLLERAYWLECSTLYRHIELRWIDRRLGLRLRPATHAYNREMLRAMAREPDPETHADIERTFAALCEIHVTSELAGARFLLVRLPTRLQVEPESFAQLLRDLEQDPADFDRTRPGGELLRRAKARGIAILDLLEPLTSGQRREPTYFREGHPNRNGIGIAADRIAAEL